MDEKQPTKIDKTPAERTPRNKRQISNAGFDIWHLFLGVLSALSSLYGQMLDTATVESQ